MSSTGPSEREAEPSGCCQLLLEEAPIHPFICSGCLWVCFLGAVVSGLLERCGQIGSAVVSVLARATFFLEWSELHH